MAKNSALPTKSVAYAGKKSGGKKSDGKSKSKRSGGKNRRARAASISGMLGYAKSHGIRAGEFVGAAALTSFIGGYRARQGKTPFPTVYGVDSRGIVSLIGILAGLWKRGGWGEHAFNLGLGVGSTWLNEKATNWGAKAADKWGTKTDSTLVPVSTPAAAPAAAETPVVPGLYIGNVGDLERREERRSRRLDRRIERLEAKRGRYEDEEDEDEAPQRKVIVIHRQQAVYRPQGGGVAVRSPVRANVRR
jgi:hypothetical protein